jgi:ABC-type taurine transport system substrate-binding protein
MRQLLVAANVVPSLLFLVTLMMEALRSSETLVLTRATKWNIPEDHNFQEISTHYISSTLLSFTSHRQALSISNVHVSNLHIGSSFLTFAITT